VRCPECGCGGPEAGQGLECDLIVVGAILLFNVNI
jgi:hypothetical protein